MTQSSLLQLARSGHPEAIAALMNSVLEPKGVVAKTQLDGDCLHIVFTSEHCLSQAAIANFVRNGLTSLGTKSFQTVKLYAKKVGQDSPLWVDSFVLGQPTVPQPAVSQPVTTQSTVSQSAVTSAAPTAASVAPSASATRSPHVSPVPSTTTPNSAQPVSQRRQPASTANSSTVKPSVQQARSGNGFAIANRYRVAIAVGVGAFLIGGTAAILTNIQGNSTSQASATKSPAPLAEMSGQSLVPPSAPASAPSPPEAQAESYLSKMNQAQQAFYQANGRFANTLEELERSASIMSHSAHYIYRLTLREQTQSVLTATPQREGLKSYAGTVLITTATTGANTLQSIVCKTNQPSTYPPILAQATEPPILCPPDATQVTN